MFCNGIDITNIKYYNVFKKILLYYVTTHFDFTIKYDKKRFVEGLALKAYGLKLSLEA